MIAVDPSPPRYVRTFFVTYLAYSHSLPTFLTFFSLARSLRAFPAPEENAYIHTYTYVFMIEIPGGFEPDFPLVVYSSNHSPSVSPPGQTCYRRRGMLLQGIGDRCSTFWSKYFCSLIDGALRPLKTAQPFYRCLQWLMFS